eukprot:1157766-Pelagomonas_calceolata.AAC.4
MRPSEKLPAPNMPHSFAIHAMEDLGGSFQTGCLQEGETHAWKGSSDGRLPAGSKPVSKIGVTKLAAPSCAFNWVELKVTVSSSADCWAFP